MWWWLLQRYNSDFVTTVSSTIVLITNMDHYYIKHEFWLQYIGAFPEISSVVNWIIDLMPGFQTRTVCNIQFCMSQIQGEWVFTFNSANAQVDYHSYLQWPTRTVWEAISQTAEFGKCTPKIFSVKWCRTLGLYVRKQSGQLLISVQLFPVLLKAVHSIVGLWNCSCLILLWLMPDDFTHQFGPCWAPNG